MKAHPAETQADLAATPAAREPVEAAPAPRLFIEQDDAGDYVYRMVETLTGQLVTEFGRDEARASHGHG